MACKLAVFRWFLNLKILSKLLYASPAWWGMTKQEDRQRINSFLARSRRLGFYPADGLSFEELCEIADKNLFDVVIKIAHMSFIKNCRILNLHTIVFVREITISHYLIRMIEIL